MFVNIINWIKSSKKTITLLLITTIFSSLTSPTADTDLGWRLKYGEYFYKYKNFLHNDIFSWSMPNFSWFNISWLFDLLTYLVYSHFNFFGLSIFAGLITVLVYLFLINTHRCSLPTKVLTVILFQIYLSPMLSPGLRPQLIVLLWLSIFGYITSKVQYGRDRYFLFFPLIMFFWVNTHGTFLFGLFYIFTFSIFYIFEHLFREDNIILFVKTRKFYLPVAISILSFFAIFCQPSGILIVKQIFNYLPGNRVSGVNEWYPIPLFSQEWLFLAIWTIIILLLVIKKRKTPYGLFQAIITLVFSYFAFNSRRMFGPFFVITLPFFLEYFSKKTFVFKSISIDIVSFFIMMSFLINGITVRMPQSKWFNTNWNDYCSLGTECSVGASKYINKHTLNGKTFNYYNYGGFSIWNNPGFKVFVDGRMDQWKNSAGYSAFIDHQKILTGDDLDLFNSYNFDYAYISSNSRLSYYLRRMTFQGSWKILYEDQKAIIFAKNKNEK